MDIRLASPDDALAISELIKRLTSFFLIDQHGRGAEGFLQSLEPQSILTLITAPNFSYFVGDDGGELLGVVAMRDNGHLYHLFVAEYAHRRGYGRKFWEHVKQRAIQAGNKGYFTVNSTVFAVPSYESLGFKITGTKVEAHGIAFVPMAMELQI